MSESLIRKYVRLILEDLPPGGGHSLMTHSSMSANTLKTPNDLQYTYEDTLGIDIDIFTTPDGKVHVKINSLENDKLSSPERVFNNEEEANNFARAYTEKIKRIMMANQT